MEATHQVALQSRTDLEKYGDNALLLFSLQLRFEIEDIDAEFSRPRQAHVLGNGQYLISSASKDGKTKVSCFCIAKL